MATDNETFDKAWVPSTQHAGSWYLAIRTVVHGNPRVARISRFFAANSREDAQVMADVLNKTKGA